MSDDDKASAPAKKCAHPSIACSQHAWMLLHRGPRAASDCGCDCAACVEKRATDPTVVLEPGKIN